MLRNFPDPLHQRGIFVASLGGFFRLAASLTVMAAVLTSAGCATRGMHSVSEISATVDGLSIGVVLLPVLAHSPTDFYGQPTLATSKFVKAVQPAPVCDSLTRGFARGTLATSAPCITRPNAGPTGLVQHSIQGANFRFPVLVPAAGVAVSSEDSMPDIAIFIENLDIGYQPAVSAYLGGLGYFGQAEAIETRADVVWWDNRRGAVIAWGHIETSEEAKSGPLAEQVASLVQAALIKLAEQATAKTPFAATAGVSRGSAPARLPREPNHGLGMTGNHPLEGGFLPVANIDNGIDTLL